MNIMITGGLGYIGSHTVVQLLKEGHRCIVIDNLSNSDIRNLDIIESLTDIKVDFENVDLLDFNKTNGLFKKYQVDAVIHFAGLKSVNESVENPLLYYETNLVSSINLLKAMKINHVKNFIFSSSATVYGEKNASPVREDYETSWMNPYGNTKLMIEKILFDMAKINKGLNVVILRYFNPVGAHISGKLKEYKPMEANNLMPHIINTANKEQPYLKVYGTDYSTKDGTGVRDYIHVEDLAYGHIKALEYAKENPGIEVFNLGTGKGYSVLEIVKEFEEVNNIQVPTKKVKRRPGDLEISYADVEKSKRKLGWESRYGLREMCRDAWNANKN